MSDAFDPTVVEETRLRELHAYWREKAAGRAMPSRADIDPVEIPALLSRIVLIEVAERIDDFRYRLVGTAVARGFKEDRTGVTLGGLRPVLENSDEVYEGYWSCYREARPTYFHGRVVSSAMEHRRYSRLLLPLSHDGRQVDMILGGFVFYLEGETKG